MSRLVIAQEIYVCDACGRKAKVSWLPSDWAEVSLHSRDQGASAEEVAETTHYCGDCKCIIFKL